MTAAIESQLQSGQIVSRRVSGSEDVSVLCLTRTKKKVSVFGKDLYACMA